jgi:hypothetical protein
VLIGSARFRLLWSLIISCLQPISSPGLCSAHSDFGHLVSAHRPRVVLDFWFTGARNSSPHLIFLLASAEFPFPAASGLRRSGAWLFSRCILHSGVCALSSLPRSSFYSVCCKGSPTLVWVCSPWFHWLRLPFFGCVAVYMLSLTLSLRSASRVSFLFQSCVAWILSGRRIFGFVVIRSFTGRCWYNS